VYSMAPWFSMGCDYVGFGFARCQKHLTRPRPRAPATPALSRLAAGHLRQKKVAVWRRDERLSTRFASIYGHSCVAWAALFGQQAKDKRKHLRPSTEDRPATHSGAPLAGSPK